MFPILNKELFVIVFVLLDTFDDLLQAGGGRVNCLWL